MEAAGLGIFMVSAGVFTILFEYPGSPVHQALSSGFLRRALIGLAMGLTAIGIIYSHWGKRSGAHLNPAVTLSFLWLGKIKPWDAVYYILAQFLGGLSGVLLVDWGATIDGYNGDLTRTFCIGSLDQMSAKIREI